MGKMRRYYGFSLIEVLLAVGTLAVGMVFIGGTFLVGVHLAGVSAERTTATVVANEALSKIRIFRPNPAAYPINSQRRFGPIDPNELAYPSERTVYPEINTLADRQYFWSALCRRDPNNPSGRTLQVTVFVSRKVGAAALYPFPIPTDPGGVIDFPIAMPVEVQGVALGNVLAIIDNPATPFDETRWIGPGFTIVEDSTGDIYRVVKHGAGPTEIILDRPWNPDGIYPAPDDFVWTVPPPVGRGKGPCIDVYQTKRPF